MKKIPVSKRKIKKNILYRSIKRLIWEIKWNAYRSKLYKKILKKKHPISTPGELIYCNPVIINHVSLNINDIDPLKEIGSCQVGDWDLEVCDLKELNIYKAFYQLIKYNKIFKETNFYNPNIRTKSEWEKNSIWEYISEYNYEERMEKINKLLSSIKKNGYRTQAELGLNTKNEIIVNIGRYGEILFFNGIHRLCIAKLLEIKQIPVIVHTRHAEWVKLKNDLYNYALLQKVSNGNTGKLYHKLAHPDLGDIPFEHNNDDRFSSIINNVITQKGTVLDIGANLGYFTIKLAELGYQCTAVEQNNHMVYFLNKFNQNKECSFRIIDGNILNIFNKPIEYDIVLALNIFHHFLKTDSDYNKFICLLKKLKIKEMFFEPHNTKEKQFINAYKNLNNEEFIKLILDNTNLLSYEKILDCAEDRHLYHLWS